LSDRALKNVATDATARRKTAKNRRLQMANQDFEPFSGKALASVVVFNTLPGRL
jgi:hypothetical protein